MANRQGRRPAKTFGSKHQTEPAKHAAAAAPPTRPNIFEGGPTPTQTSATTPVEAASRQTEQSGFLRNRASLTAADATDTHQTDYMVEFRVRTSDLVGAGGQVLLRNLSDLGFAWRDVARMLGVSVPAIQKWRRGEGLSGDNARRLARLVAGIEIIQRFNPLITDIALWFEAPIVDEAPVTPIDLWTSGNQQLVLEHARVDPTSEVDPHLTMDSFDAGWRDKYASNFEIFRAGDGEVSIRPREK